MVFCEKIPFAEQCGGFVETHQQIQCLGNSHPNGACLFYMLHLKQLLSLPKMIALIFTSSFCLPVVVKLHTFSIQRTLELFCNFLEQYFRKFLFLV